MNTIDSSALLARMRLLAARAEALPTPPVTEEVRPAGSFGQVLGDALRQVNANQQAAASLATRFERGDAEVDLAEVMVAMQRAQVGFQAVTQVRNRLVSAYQDIMNMPV